MSSENERNELRQNQTIPKIMLHAQSGVNDFVFSILFSVFQTTYRNNPLFDLKVYSDDSKDVITALGASIPVHGGLDLTKETGIIVVASWRNIEEVPTPELSTHLQKAVQRGVHITTLYYDTHTLAYTGLLDGRTAAAHWSAENDPVRRFPKINLDTNHLYTEDGNFLTSADTAGGLDCRLYLIRKIHGATTASDFACTLVAAPHREGGQAQFIHRPVECHIAGDKINHLLDKLRQDLATPYRLDDLAKKLAVSRQTFIRHFSQVTGMNFGEWPTTERLWQVQDLLGDTDLPIERIAEQSGFGSAANLHLQSKVKFKVDPNAWRKVFGRQLALVNPKYLSAGCFGGLH